MNTFSLCFSSGHLQYVYTCPTTFAVVVCRFRANISGDGREDPRVRLLLDRLRAQRHHQLQGKKERRRKLWEISTAAFSMDLTCLVTNFKNLNAFDTPKHRYEKIRKVRYSLVYMRKERERSNPSFPLFISSTIYFLLTIERPELFDPPVRSVPVQVQGAREIRLVNSNLI